MCRIIHTSLTGPKAKQSDGVQEDLLHKVWGSLDRCWQDLEDLRKIGTAEIIEVEDMERFIHGWQVRRVSVSRKGTSLGFSRVPAGRFSFLSAVSVLVFRPYWAAQDLRPR